MWDLILGLLAYTVLQGLLLVVYGHWTDALKSVQTPSRSGDIRRDRRRLKVSMASALCLMVLEGVVYFGIFFRLRILIQSVSGHTVGTLFWAVITLAMGISALVDMAFCSAWILQSAKSLLKVMPHNSALRNGTRTNPGLASGNLMSASRTWETSPLLERAVEGLPNLPRAATAEDGYPNNLLDLVWVPRDEIIRKAIADATRNPMPTPPLVSPLTTTPTAPSTSSSGSDFSACYVDSEFSAVQTKCSSKSAASAKSLPEFFAREEDYDEEELTILDQTMTL